MDYILPIIVIGVVLLLLILTVKMILAVRETDSSVRACQREADTGAKPHLPEVRIYQIHFDDSLLQAQEQNFFVKILDRSNKA